MSGPCQYISYQKVPYDPTAERAVHPRHDDIMLLAAHFIAKMDLTDFTNNVWNAGRFVEAYSTDFPELDEHPQQHMRDDLPGETYWVAMGNRAAPSFGYSVIFYQTERLAKLGELEREVREHKQSYFRRNAQVQ